MEKYNRKAIFENLKKYDPFSYYKESDFIEVTEWGNGEGFDVCVNAADKIDFKLTYGQFDLIKKLIKKLNDE